MCSTISLMSNWQLFESSALMHISAVKSLLSALRQLLDQYVPGNLSGSGQTSSLQIGSITFSVERMITILVNNLHSMCSLFHFCYAFSFYA